MSRFGAAAAAVPLVALESLGAGVPDGTVLGAVLGAATAAGVPLVALESDTADGVPLVAEESETADFG